MKSLKVGIFAIVALSGFAFMSTKISNKGSFWEKYYTYKTLLDDADGIFKRSKIRVAGIDAGYIEDIRLEGNKALIVFKIKDDIVITDQTKLKIKTVGFLGEKFLDLKVTSLDETQRLADGSTIVTDKAKGLDELTEVAGDSMEDVKFLLAKFRHAVENEETNNALKDIVINMKEALESVNEIASQNSAAVNRMVTNMETITKGLAREFNQSNSQALINKTDEMAEIIDNLRKTTENLNGVMGGLNAGEGTAGKILKDDTIHDSVADTMTNVNRLVRRVTNLDSDLAMYAGQNPEKNSEYTQLDIDLYPAPERFYRFGFTQSNFGPDGGSTKIVTKESGGTTTVEREREVQEYPFKLNIQFGRIFHRFVFRIGFIESTGGFGVDYLLTDFLGTKLTFEAFDFYAQNGVNIRTALNFRIWNFLYARFTGEDLLNNSRSYTIGAGLKFTDEDLASLLGLAARSL